MVHDTQGRHLVAQRDGGLLDFLVFVAIGLVIFSLALMVIFGILSVQASQNGDTFRAQQSAADPVLRSSLTN
jgi:hypothetical protein